MKQTKHLHFIGIGGIGMSALAKISLQQGCRVSGSDLRPSAVTQMLEKLGATVTFGHHAEVVKPGMEVVYTTGLDPQNPEFLQAAVHACQTHHRSDLLAFLLHQQKGLAVAGTHGKTTTSSLLTWVLHSGGLDPSFAVGGILPQFQTNGNLGKGAYFVAEACESDGTLIKYHPFGAIVTNIDNDHLTHYGSPEKIDQTFKQFLKQVESPKHLFWCGEDARLQALSPPGISYGFGTKCMLKASNFYQKGLSSFFTVDFQGKQYPDIELALMGRHNVLNALAVFGLALAVGMSEPDIRQAFKAFQGVQRRCERKGESKDVLVIDDYGHHPTEIRATVSALKEAFPKRRLVVAYQPHRYSRAQECLGTYGDAFGKADVLVISTLYSAGEAPLAGITDESIYQDMTQAVTAPHQLVDRKKLVGTILSLVKPGDVVLTLGAGDITQAGPEILSGLEGQP